MRIHEFAHSLWESRSPAFRAWQAVILAIRSVTLAAFCWLGSRVAKAHRLGAANECVPTSRAEWALTCLSVAELLFFGYYCHVRGRLQLLKPLPHRCATPEERKRLVAHCIFALRPVPEGITERPSPFLRAALEKWFLGAPLESIKRTDFLRW